MQNKLRKTDHGNAWTIEGPIVAIIDIRHGPEMLQHSVWYQTLIVLANRKLLPQLGQLHSATTAE